MRCIILLTVLCLVSLVLASPVWEDDSSAADDLLAVDASVEHENEGVRQARNIGFGGFGRGFGGGFGRGFGGYGGYRGGYGGGFGGYGGYGHHHHHHHHGGFYG